MHRTIKQEEMYELFELEEIKNFLRVNGEHDDLLIKSLLRTAIFFAENFIEQEIIKKSYEQFFVFNQRIFLKTPLIFVESMKVEGLEEAFEIRKNELIPFVRIGSKITIKYVCGLEKEQIPQDIKIAILNHVLSLYDAKISNGIVPKMAMEIYTRYKKINL